MRQVVAQMKEHDEFTVRAMLGDEVGDDKEITVSNRRLRWAEDGLEYESDEKHVKAILESFGLNEGSKTCQPLE